MRVGYARVSSKSQNLGRQITKLKQDGCKKIFKEKVSGATTNRPQLHKMLNYIRDDDIVEVVALDRLGRNKDDDLHVLQLIKSKGATTDIANFALMTPPSKKPNEDENHYKQRLNTYSTINNILIQLLAYVAETERREIKERQKQGIKLAKKNHVYKGADTKFTRTSNAVQNAFTQYFNRDKNRMSISQIARANEMSRRTFYRKLKAFKPKKKDFVY